MWQKFKNECEECELCKQDNLLYPTAFPVMMKSFPRNTDILFILEAPNFEDTHDVNKKYLTVDTETDPSGKFMYELFTHELRFDMQDLFLTNSVLCLPAKNEKYGNYPVTSKQQKNCSKILRRMIDTFNPKIVCPLGTKALLATRKIQEHNFRKMATAFAQPTNWYNRILFPLYHTSALARNPRFGRPEKEQRMDWQKLKRTWETVNTRVH
jgi:uracil-DNA glycosylase family 4